MQAKKYLRTLRLVLFSIFIVWHVIAIAIVGPGTPSYMRNQLVPVFGDYLRFMQLDNRWRFYSPSPYWGSQLSYEITTSDGQVLEFPLTTERGKYEHAYFRYTNFYVYLFDTPEYSKKKSYDKSVVRFLCAQHEPHSIVTLSFLLLEQKPFSYSDFQKGSRPLDKEFVTTSRLGPYSCEAPA